MPAAIVVLSTYRTAPERLLRLVRRVSVKDRWAFARLYHALAPSVSAVAGGEAHDIAGAGPITSAVFMEVWTTARSHTASGTDVAAWIIGIAHRRLAESQPGATGRSAQFGDDLALAGLLTSGSVGRHAGGGGSHA